jgi:DNA replication protein DnaC
VDRLQCPALSRVNVLRLEAIQALAQVAQSNQLTALYGDPGFGKTTLLMQLAHHLVTTGSKPAAAAAAAVSGEKWCVLWVALGEVCRSIEYCFV